MREGSAIDIDALASFYEVSPGFAREAFNPVYLSSESPGLTHPDSEHADVFELERISYLTTADPRSVGELPDSTPEQQDDYPLMRKIEHAKQCEICVSGIIKYASLRPSADDLYWA